MLYCSFPCAHFSLCPQKVAQCLLISQHFYLMWSPSAAGEIMVLASLQVGYGSVVHAKQSSCLH